MNDLYQVIRRPLVTEKGAQVGEQNKYCFEVAKAANKIEIRKAVETLFGVKVLTVNTMHVRGRTRRVNPKSARLGTSSSTKKAFVTLAEGHVIDFYGEQA